MCASLTAGWPCWQSGAFVRRRKFLRAVGGALTLSVLAPRSSQAQQAPIPIVGFLCSASAAGWTLFVAGFRNGLNEGGYVEGHNVAIEYRWAEGQLERLPGLTADLIARPVAVIVASGGGAPALAAKAATKSIPIVFAHGADPVKSGLVTSLNRPAGNVTGVTFLATAIIAKRVELLHELIPTARTIGVLFNPDNSDAKDIIRDIRVATDSLGITPVLLSARQEREFDDVFATLARQRVPALLIAGDRLFTAGRIQLAVLAARHAIPTLHNDREYTAIGGLITYGPDIVDAYRQVGVYTARILKGQKPADLPVMQAAKFELIINLKTAKALGVEIPPKLLALADRVIE
jgi:putative ABC transport system substrate-binding protein